MTTEEAKNIFRTSIKFKLTPDTEWMESVLTNLENGTANSTTCSLELKRRIFQSRMKMAINWTSDMFDMGVFLEKRTKPPRPQQTRLAVTASQAANIVTLYGPSRTGKTTAALHAAALRAATSDNPTICVLNAVDLCDMDRKEMREARDRALECEAIVLDDIDKGSKGDVMVSAIYKILSVREKKQYAGTVIVTTNLFGNDLAKQLTSRINPTTGAAILGRLTDGVCIDFAPNKINFDATHEFIRKKLVAMAPNDSDWLDYLDGFGRLTKT